MTDRVGPILEAGDVGQAVIAAIRKENGGVEVNDRGSYLRVLVATRCIVTRRTIEGFLGRPFKLPSDLEMIMPSFQGKFSVSEDEASWTFEARA